MPAVHLDVKPYDNHHCGLLKAYRSAPRIDRAVISGVRPSVDCFLTYMVFIERAECDGFRSFGELAGVAVRRRDYFRDHLNYECGTVRSTRPHRGAIRDIAERLGEAGALCVVSDLHNLSDADWERIPEGKTKSLDYHRAFDDDGAVEVECKGSIVARCDQKPSTVSKHKSSIVDKKRLAPPTRDGALRYGVITAVDNRATSTARCWLLDPEPESRGLDPRKHRLLARLRFYYRNLRLVTPNSEILVALRNRIRAIERAPDVGHLDGLRLVNADGDPFHARSINFSTHSSAYGEEVVGQATPVSSDEVFFFGMERRLYQLIVDQDFGAISSYKSSIESANDGSGRLVIDKEVASRFDMETTLQKRADSRRGRFSIEVSGRYHITSSGRAFGFLPVR